MDGQLGQAFIDAQVLDLELWVISPQRKFHRASIKRAFTK